MAFTAKAYLSSLPDGARQQLLTTHVSLGYHPTTQDELLVPDADRYAGTYVLGVQGMGKSGLLEGLIQQDAINGKAIIVIDPHGDLTANCLAALPASRLPHTYVLDMEDADFPFGVNLFSAAGEWKKLGSVAQTQVLDRVTHVMDVLFADVLKQAHLPRYLRAAAITLLSNDGATLYDMQRLFTDDTFRHKLLANVDDWEIQEFWRTEFDELSTAARKQHLGALLSRLQILFLGRPLVRNIIGQRRQTINFRQAIERKEIIFVRLPVKTVAQDAEVIGTVIVAQLHAAIFSFGNLPEAQRQGVSVYIDEFQHFVTRDIAELFTEGRKFGVRLVIAHQTRQQLPNLLQASTMTARTIVCFRPTTEDARELAPVFPDTTATIAPEDIETDICGHWLKHGSPDRYTTVFIEEYLKKLQYHRRGKQIVVNMGWTLRDAPGYALKNLIGEPNPQLVYDPIPYLNNLFRDVMRSHNANQHIPAEAITGFGSVNRDFMLAMQKTNGEYLWPDYPFAPPLVINRGYGPEWTREPENGLEQLLHLVFHLRMALHYYAQHPLGKETHRTAADVAQLLVCLKARSAFVRSGDTVGVIYTHATPGRVMGEELAKRLSTLQDNTRARYCLPREAVEQTFRPAHYQAIPAEEAANDGLQDTVVVKADRERQPEQLARWEEVPDDA